MPLRRTATHDPARSCFGIAMGFIGAAYLMVHVHGVNVHQDGAALVVLLAATAATIACLAVGVADAARGRIRALYFALAPAFALVLTYHLANERFGGAQRLAFVAWLAVALLVGVEGWLLAANRRGVASDARAGVDDAPPTASRGDVAGSPPAWPQQPM